MLHNVLYSWCDGAMKVVVNALIADPSCTLTSAPPTGLCLVLLTALLTASPPAVWPIVATWHVFMTYYRWCLVGAISSVIPCWRFVRTMVSASDMLCRLMPPFLTSNLKVAKQAAIIFIANSLWLIGNLLSGWITSHKTHLWNCICPSNLADCNEEPLMIWIWVSAEGLDPLLNHLVFLDDQGIGDEDTWFGPLCCTAGVLLAGTVSSYQC